MYTRTLSTMQPTIWKKTHTRRCDTIFNMVLIACVSNGWKYDHEMCEGHNQNPATRNRTRDHLIAATLYSQMLYQLSYSRSDGMLTGQWLGALRLCEYASYRWRNHCVILVCRVAWWNSIDGMNGTHPTNALRVWWHSRLSRGAFDHSSATYFTCDA